MEFITHTQALELKQLGFDEPAEGRSVIIDPHHFSYTWLTTEITSFTKDKDKLIFSTKNSNYILEIED
jgi:hypothetical protein